ncbi:MAG: IS1634 family transposase [Actinomycetota bacterium]|nr:IS1634 family transposase [Actinomycetota bacterium]
MYLRRTQRKRADGSTVGYLQLAHNERVGGAVQAKVLVNLGREDLLDVDALRRLAASITRYAGEDGALEGVGEGFTVTQSRAMGGVWLLDGLWRQLGIAEALAGVVGARRFSTDVERVLFALVANRCLEPASKLAAAEWASRDVHVAGLEAMDDDHAYRAMDLLVDADAQAKVQEAVFFATADLLNLEVDLLFFDTTSTYFERDTPDAASEEGGPAFRAYGHSKDSRPDLPQVIIGLAVTREGIPVRVWVWPGNTNDMSVVKEVKDGLRDWRLGRVVTVVDRGFSSEENLRYLTRAGGHWIAGERMRNASAKAQEALSRPGRYATVRDNLRVKEVLVGDGDAPRRYVVCHNPVEAERDKLLRDVTITRLEHELDQIRTARAKANSAKENEAHHRAECALRDHPSLGRFLRQTATGRLLIDRAKVKAEERLDGKYLLSTSDPDLSAEDVALGYKNLLEAERGFRDMKSTLELRPVFHRLEHRIRAHVLICWLALLLIRIAERQSGHTWRRVALELQRLHLVTLTGPDGTVQQTTAPTPLAAQILGATKVKAPPQIAAITPA